ncbi:MAG: putative porin [Bacteroidales bacterium]|nr:putative porin [Bacteroidales bacterium]
MKNWWSEIFVPAVMVGLTAAGTLGVETSRVLRPEGSFHALRALDLDSLRTDTTHLLPIDSLGTQDLTDTLEDDFDLFAEPQEDTLPHISARDTMKVPDSLRATNPFLYRWYVATKDSLTHRIVVDSLKAEGDSLDWPRIDSLYLADSTAAAIERFNRWYAGLTKAERKRYDYEQKLPAILHRQDSILQRKDSLRAIRDSIRESTPRILETAFLPDSMFYKRLVTWHHDRYFNKVELFDWDTTSNYHFNDFPYLREDVGGSFLGVAGSAVQTYDFFKRDDPETVSFYAPYESWTYNPSNLPMYNTKTPYTELQYDGNLFNTETKAADNVRIFTTQNIFPELNIAMEFKTYGGAGILQNEKTRNKTAFVAANYLGKKYLAHGGLISNTVLRAENGGIQDNFWIRDTTVDAREIAVSLSTAQNAYKKRTWFFDQSYRIPLSFIEDLKHRGDTAYVKADTLDTDMTTAFIGTASEYSVFTKMYTDAVTTSDQAGSDFFDGRFYMNPSKSSDSLRVMRLDNRLFVRFQPWHEDAVISKLEGGLGYRHQSHYLLPPGSYLRRPSSYNWNSAYVYAGAEGRINRYVEWNALGRYTFAGTEVNDLLVKADARLNLYPFRRQRSSPLTLGARFETRLKEPDFYEQRFYSNHYQWDNDFTKVSTTRIEAFLDVPRWKLHAEAGYALLSGNIYYDTLGVARQNDPLMSVLTARLRWDVQVGRLLHLDNQALVQYSSDEEVLPLPLAALNLRYYIQFPIVRDDVMRMQLGANIHYNTGWYAPSFNPVAGVFINQKQYKYGNVPRFDLFANIQWKKACIFVKYENAGQGWPADKKDYFSAHHYIHTTRAVKVGILWPFYPNLGSSKTLSSRAGSGMGGGGGSGLGGGLKGAMGGLGM